MAVLKYYNTATSAWEYIAASTTANFTSWKKTMSGGETSVSGTDDNAVTLSYTVGLEQVFINGVLQVRGSDYTATTGTSVTGLSALVANDIVTVVCYAPFNVANTIAPTVVDAKGDLLAGTAADTVGRLAVGTNGQLLAADSAESTGLKWANGGLTLLTTNSFSAVSSVSLPTSTFTSTYKDYRIIFTVTAVSTTSSVQLRLRASGTDNTTANYDYCRLYASMNTPQAVGTNNDTTFGISAAAVDTASNFTLDIINPQATAMTFIAGTLFNTNAGANQESGIVNGRFQLTDSFDAATFTCSTGNFTGTYSVYGYNK